MIVTTKLADTQKELERLALVVSLKGHGSSSFLHVTNNGRGVEISEHGEDL